MVKYLNFHNSSFALRYFLNVNGKATMWNTPCYHCLEAYGINLCGIPDFEVWIHMGEVRVFVAWDLMWVDECYL
jgi:hypothetical protein